MILMETLQEKQFVQIGQVLGEDTQYLNADETVFCENGKLIAGIPGFIEIDRTQRTIRIKGIKGDRDKIPKAGDIIYGTVYMIRRSAVGIQIGAINGKMVSDMGYIGNIHISNVSSRYVDKLDNLFQVTDIIRAQILPKKSNEYRLTTEGPHFGVISAACKFCGTKMQAKTKDQAMCPFCGFIDRKKLADDFGRAKDQIVF